jgi:putative hydrolase of the HAD superfamily
VTSDTDLPIDTLFLDAGGVLTHPSWRRVSDALAVEGIDVSPEALERAERFAKRDIDEASVVGATNDAGRGWLYFNSVLAHAGISRCDRSDAALAVLREYHRSENLWEYVPDDVEPALRQLRDRGLTLVVVSNANGRLRYLFDRLALTPFFDVVLDSFEWGAEKPDPRLFRLALEQSGARAETTAHVGDLYHIDVAGARAAGLREGILLDPHDMYPRADCRRIKSLAELIPLIGTSLDSGS